MAKEPRIFRFEAFELEEASLTLRLRGDPVEIHATPLRLLLYFLERAQQLITKEELLKRVWPGVVVSDTALSSALKAIRQALGDDGAQQYWVRTHKGKGYRFAQPVAVAERAERPAPAPARRSLSGSYRMPSMFFVGREHELARLEQLLADPVPGLCISIEGLAGIGKTELALQLAYRLAVRRTFPGGIFWLDAQRGNLVEAWGTRIADQCQIGGPTLQDRCDAVIRGLETQTERVLVILDNVSEWRERLQPAPLPFGPHIHFVITTRERNTGGPRFVHASVDVLPASADRVLLEGVSGRSFDAGAEPLLRYLGGHALALEIAAGFLGTYRTEAPAVYLASLRGYDTAQDQPVAQAFRSVWDRLAEPAREAWWLASFFEPEPVNAAQSSDCGIPPDGIRRLQELHVIQADSSGAWTMHRLSRDFAQSAFPASPRALDLLLAMGPQLVHRGSSAQELEQLYGRAVEIAGEIGLLDYTFTALAGRWQTARLHGNWTLCREVAERMYELAAPEGDECHLMIAFQALGESAFYMGDIQQACDWLSQAVAASESAKEPPENMLVRPLVSLFAYLAFVYCLDGRADAALEWSQRSLATARASGRPTDLAVAAIFRGTLHYLRLELPELAAAGDWALAVCEQHHLHPMRAAAERIVARARLALDPESGRSCLERMERGRAELAKMSVGSGLTLHLGTLAESCSLLGERAAGLRWVDEGLQTGERTGERFFEPELWRIRASLLDDPREAAASLGRALEIAAAQGARWWELRAACDLAALEDRVGSDFGARARLTDTLERVTASPALPDIARARALLASGLSRPPA